MWCEYSNKKNTSAHENKDVREARRALTNRQDMVNHLQTARMVPNISCSQQTTRVKTDIRPAISDFVLFSHNGKSNPAPRMRVSLCPPIRRAWTLLPAAYCSSYYDSFASRSPIWVAVPPRDWPLEPLDGAMRIFKRAAAVLKVAYRRGVDEVL